LFHSTELITRHIQQKEQSTRTRALCAYAWKLTAYELYPEDPGLSLQAEAHSHQLGGSQKPFHAGQKIRLMALFLGWRKAKSLCS
jgi:hypothetical protein